MSSDSEEMELPVHCYQQVDFCSLSTLIVNCKANKDIVLLKTFGFADDNCDLFSDLDLTPIEDSGC